MLFDGKCADAGKAGLKGQPKCNLVNRTPSGESLQVAAISEVAGYIRDVGYDPLGASHFLR